MQADALTRKLQELGTQKVHEQSVFQSWVDDVSALFGAAESWLASEIASGAVRLLDQSAWVQEPDGDRYQMKQLALQFDAGPLILLVPRTRSVVGAIVKDGDRIGGAKGRVDLVNFHTRKSIGVFRSDRGRWLVPTPDEPEMWAALDQTRFRSAIAELLA